MKNIIVVTGGAGFVGSNLIEFFLKKTNKKIISVDNYSTGLRNNHIRNKRVKYLNLETSKINLNHYHQGFHPNHILGEIICLNQ